MSVGFATPSAAQAPVSRPQRLAVASFLLAPVVGYLAPLGLWGPLALILLLMIWDLAASATLRAAVLCRPKALAGWALLGVPLLGLATSPMSLLPKLSAQQALVSLLLAVTLLLLLRWVSLWASRWRWTCVLGMGASTTLIGSVMSADLLLGSPLATLLHGPASYVATGGSLSRGAALHGFVLVPTLFALVRFFRPRDAFALGALFLVLSAWILKSSTNDSAYLAMMASAAVGLLIWAIPLLRWLAPLAVAGTLLAMPVLIAPMNQMVYCQVVEQAPSLAHRLRIWGTVTDLIAQKPLLGWGVDSARAAPGGKQILDLRACDANGQDTGTLIAQGEAIPLHPHNGPLDLWYSLGLGGVLLMSIAAASGLLALLQSHRRGRLSSALLAAQACQMSITISISYGLWQAWHLSAIILGLVALIATIGLPKRPATKGGPRAA